MHLGILSDTHNHLGNLERALDRFRRAGMTTLIHCGDLTEARLVSQLIDFRVIFLYGNMEGSPLEIKRQLRLQDRANFAGATYTGSLGGVAIAATHGHLPGKVDELVRSGRYAFVFHGHTHRRRDEVIGNTRIINPGALGGTRYEPRSICFLDLESGAARFIEIAPW